MQREGARLVGQSAGGRQLWDRSLERLGEGRGPVKEVPKFRSADDAD